MKPATLRLVLLVLAALGGVVFLALWCVWVVAQLAVYWRVLAS